MDGIKNFLTQHDMIYVDIDTESIKKINDLLVNNIYNEPLTSMEMLYYGLYYKINKDYVKMKKYYLMAIEKGNDIAMYNLAKYYEKTKNNVEMEKYYLMAIEKGNDIVMYKFAIYHYDNKNYIDMEKYYIMAIEKGNDHAMINFANYHYDNKNYIDMEKYYIMAIEKGNGYGLNRLVEYYKHNQYELKLLSLYIHINHHKIIKLFNKIALQTLSSEDESQFLELLTTYQFENNDQLCTSLKLLLNAIHGQMDLMALHFEYTVHGKGFNEAKADFFNRL